MTDPELRAQLASLATELAGDELRVLVLNAERLLTGRAQYGQLILAKDGRCWTAEMLAELIDATQYGAMLLMQLQAETMPAPAAYCEEDL